MGRTGEGEERKLISIAAVHYSYENGRKNTIVHVTSLYAIANDGSVWRKSISSDWEDTWEEIESIPK